MPGTGDGPTVVWQAKKALIVKLSTPALKGMPARLVTASKVRSRKSVRQASAGMNSLTTCFLSGASPNPICVPCSTVLLVQDNPSDTEPPRSTLTLKESISPTSIAIPLMTT